MNLILKLMNVILKLMNLILKLMNLFQNWQALKIVGMVAAEGLCEISLKMMNFVFKMMKFALTMMSFGRWHGTCGGLTAVWYDFVGVFFCVFSQVFGSFWFTLAAHETLMKRSSFGPGQTSRTSQR